jgi:hypothetical protein
MLLFGLDNAATSLARIICSGVGTSIERPLILPPDVHGSKLNK